MERKDFVNILNLAVTSAFPEVDMVALYKHDILHVYYNDDSFKEIYIGENSNASLFMAIWGDLWCDRPSLGVDVPETKAKVSKARIKYSGDTYTDIRLHEYEGEDVYIAPYKGFLWVWGWNKKIITTIPLRVHGQP